MVQDALSRMTMGSVDHVEDGKKDFVKDVHRLVGLSVRLEDSPKEGIMVHHDSELSLVDDVKSKQIFILYRCN